ncbi:hypothetical protein EZV62_008560 [Acer yangbiense]|uniref:Receptor-like serine/threonine-protein kinase n=1 Tax=Acer yangbiense TaxID=1000413 RepID=A0A5C7IE17_9ROSI|nr:hypothetical protein EZV62_008560 [Acer yangbiense]
MDILSFLLISLKLLFFFYEFAFAIDSISSSESIRDGGRTLVSVDGRFELGFFSPGSSKNRYVGIWYKKVPVKTVVWVANRINPINDSSGVLMINSTGSPVVVMRQNKTVVWSANSTKKGKSSVVLQLLNSGNLVLRDEQSSGDGLGSYLWQSFDYPCDTMLPDMKIGWDLKTGLERRLSSWKSPDDPSPGDFTCGVELRGNPEVVMWKGSNKFVRNSPWNGITASGAIDLRHNSIFELNFVNNEDELYYTFKMIDKSMFSIVVLNKTSYLRERLTWSETTQNWNVYSYVPTDNCDNYGLCGAYGNCIITQSPNCQCLEGFKPKSTGYGDWSEGCVRNKALNYSRLDAFIKFNRLKLPDTTNSWVNKSLNLEQCRVKCLENSSCMAYSNLDIRGGGSGCAIWFGDLIDIKHSSNYVQDLFIRMSASELGTKEGPKMKIVVTVTTTAAVAGVLIVGYYIYKSRTNLDPPFVDPRIRSGQELKKRNESKEKFEFDDNNDGSRDSGILSNGVVVVIVLGFVSLCKVLIVLARVSFEKSASMRSEKQLSAIIGVLGFLFGFLIYSGVLSSVLDFDFALLWINPLDEMLLNKNVDSSKEANSAISLVGNVGLSPEDFAKLRLSCLLLSGVIQIVALRPNLQMYLNKAVLSWYQKLHASKVLDLDFSRAKAWKLWKESRPLELIDPFLGESCTESEAIRCIHISLLCLEHQPDDRPSMSSVVLMLGSDNALPEPKQPGFLMDKKPQLEPDSSNKPEFSSSNEVTISLLEAR